MDIHIRIRVLKLHLNPYPQPFQNPYLYPLGCEFYISESVFFVDANIHKLSASVCTPNEKTTFNSRSKDHSGYVLQLYGYDMIRERRFGNYTHAYNILLPLKRLNKYTKAGYYRIHFKL